MPIKVARISSSDSSAGLDLTLDELAELSGIDKDLLLQRIAAVISDRGEDIVSVLGQE
jgi:hypothetical protein